MSVGLWGEGVGLICQILIYYMKQLTKDKKKTNRILMK